MRLRFSISRLMAIVLLVAVGLAAAMAGAFPFAVVIAIRERLIGPRLRPLSPLYAPQDQGYAIPEVSEEVVAQPATRP